MEMHEWVQVPQAVAHLLEHHSDLGHHDEDTGDHHGPDGHQEPFGEDCHGEFCACSGMVAIAPGTAALLVSTTPLTTTVRSAFLPAAPCAFAGNVWNPPKA